jgi:hypothetical protein
MYSEAVVIRGDMIKSREVKAKKEFWSKLDRVISEINSEFERVLISKFEIFKGDEITGMTEDLKDAYTIVAKLFEKIHPLKIRVVISEGKIDQNRPTEVLNELDGEVFWNASAAMNILKKKKRYIKFTTKNEHNDDILTSLADIVTELKYEWTEKEKEIVQTYEETQNQIKAANQLKIFQQSVSDGLRRAKYKQIREAEKALKEFL